MSSMSQRVRLGILVAYVAALFCSSWVIFGTWLPPTNEKGLWFYSGLAALLLGNLLVTPFYTKPVDAIANGVAGLTALSTVNLSSLVLYSSFDHFLWWACLAFILVILLAGILSIAFKDSLAPPLQKISRSLFIVCDVIGNPKLVFSTIFLFALVVFHKTHAREYIGI